MGYVLAALILLLGPTFVVLIGRSELRRNQALMAIGALMFITGSIGLEGWLVSWPVWQGTIRGMGVLPMDMLGLALIFTRKRGADQLPFRSLIGLYAIPVALSAVVSAVPMASTFTLWQLARMTVLFIAIGGEVARPGALRFLMIGLAAGLIVQAGYVVPQKLQGVVQASGTVVHQNILGIMVELALIPLVAAVLEGEKSKIVYGGIIAGLIIVAAGGSRGTLALVGGGLVVLTLLALARRSTPRKLKVVGLGVLALAVAAPLALGTLKERFGDSSLVTEESERAAFQRAASAMAADHPLGVGANNYVSVANTQGYAERAGVSWIFVNRSAPVHNAYLLARAETGWFGQIALITLIVVPIAAGLSLAFGTRKGMPSGVALGSAVAYGTVGLHNMYEYAWHLQETQVLFFMNLGIIGGAIRAARIEKVQRRRATRQRAPQREPLIGPPGTPTLA